MQALSILFGAGVTAFISQSLGIVLFRWLNIRLHRGEERVLAFVVGSAFLSAIVFLLCATHLARKGVYLTLGAICIAASLRMKAAPAHAPPALPRLWRWTFFAIFTIFTVPYFFTAMAPEISPDGTAYHLAVIDHYNRAHGFERVSTNFLFNLPQGAELVFLVAYAFGKHSAAALTHLTFLAALPWMMLAYGRRFGFALAGAAAGLFVYASPMFGIDGASAYVDAASAAALFAMFYLLQVWASERRGGLLIPVAVLAGFAFAVKYTSFPGALYAFAFVAWKLWRERRANWTRPVLTMIGIVALFAVPWLAKSWLWVGNPMTPFANRLFPNPWVHVSFEDHLRGVVRSYELPDRRRIPLELTVRGEKLSGLLGPLFLFTPFGLLALKWKQGRQALIAGAILALPYASNIGTRFLIPAVPFFALALAMALAQWRWLLLAATLAHAALSWPDVVDLYCDPSAFRIEKTIPWRAALRIESEDSYLRRKWPGYAVDRFIEKTVPPGETLFMFGQTAECYTTRKILVGFLSAPNELLRDILLTPIVTGYQPTLVLSFEFPKRTVRKLRAIQTWTSGEEMWDMAEFRVIESGKELPRAAEWRLTAQPNPWDVQLAFDNSLVTRWRTWQPAAPRNYVEVDFGQPSAIDGVTIACSSGYINRQVRLETLDARGAWSRVAANLNAVERTLDFGLRRAATAEVKARGVRYLLLNDEDLGAADFREHARAWGITPLGEAAGSRIYRID